MQKINSVYTKILFCDFIICHHMLWFSGIIMCLCYEASFLLTISNKDLDNKTSFVSIYFKGGFVIICHYMLWFSGIIMCLCYEASFLLTISNKDLDNKTSFVSIYFKGGFVNKA